MGYSVAIDGPAGAGKSTIAKLVAKEKEFIYVDTGAMYRAMAIHFLRCGIKADDSEKISAAVNDVNVTISYVNGEQQVFLNGENVTSMLRTEEVGNMASASSVNGDVRKKLVELQRKLAASACVVMDGRDIGTVVLPNADVKVYLTASVEVRAQRRYKELIEKGQEADLEKIKKDIEERDYRDMNRDISPLRQAEDAILVDSSNMTIEENARAIIELIDKNQAESCVIGSAKAIANAFVNEK
ncbi:MAG: (d)CMP kinase [Lachnospiraceae bacterium]|nr:(d)CMP kinase [Lachnospiraceae bacterium]